MLEHRPLAGQCSAVVIPGEDLVAGVSELIAASALDGSAHAWFGDHELLGADGTVASRSYVPDWSPEYLRQTDVVNGPIVVRDELLGVLDELTAPSPRGQRFELQLRLLERGVRVQRVPAVLGRRQFVDEAPVAAAEAYQIVDGHLRRSGISGVASLSSSPGVATLRRTPRAMPRVSVVIPTRGGTGRVWGRTRTYVVHAVQSLLARSTYPDLEIVVVADTSTPQWVLDALVRIGDQRIVVVPYSAAFNFSDKINRGVAAASGDLLLLLNDDTELEAVDSIESMVAYFGEGAGAEGVVGAVGARLLFDDGTVQHAGHVYSEQPLHAFRMWPANVAGPGHRLMLARECSGVTAAALMVDRGTFDSVGGFPMDFPLDFNDIGFCLAVRRTGRRIIWTPDAVWHHFEGRSRTRGPRPDEFTRLVAQWGHELVNDPYYHPLLEVRRGDWSERAGMPPNDSDAPWPAHDRHE